MEKSTKNHYYVNWVDGMKINKSHFLDSDNANIALISKATSISVNQNKYGLLPDIHADESQDSIQLSLDGQKALSIQINRCKAVTLGGYYIDISNETNQLLDKSGKFTKVSANFDTENITADGYYVVLDLNPFEKLPIGEANSQEEPPRHPSTIAKYSLAVIPENELNDSTLGNSFLIVGKVSFNGENPELDLNYIPPCYSIQSHQDLVYIYSEIGVFFKSIEKYCLQIIQKIFQKKQSNELAVMVLAISQNVWQYTSAIIPEYHIEDRTASPVKIITKLITLSRIIKNSMDTYIGTGKEELVNYLVDWSDTTQGEFEKLLADMIDIEYKHYDVNQSLGTVAKFSKIMLSLFKKLEELDYIGKKADSNIFVKEEVVAKQDVKQRRSFLLD